MQFPHLGYTASDKIRTYLNTSVGVLSHIYYELLKLS